MAATKKIRVDRTFSTSNDVEDKGASSVVEKARQLDTSRTINGVGFNGTANISFGTDSVSEGSTNRYYTDARARAAVSASTGISYNSSTGAITNSGVLSVNGSTGAITGIANASDVHYIGTTSVALNRTSANLALTGISSVTLPGSTSGTVQLIPTAAVGVGTVLTIPATTGTIVTTGDTGTVTNTMLAGSIANAKLTNSSVTVTAGTGLSGGGAVSLGGSVTLTNAGVTSLTTSSGLSTNTSATGAVSITNTGVLTVATSTGISTSASSGAITLTNTGVTSAVAGTDISVSGATGAVTINNTATLSTVTGRGATTGSAISITNATASTSKITGALIVTGGVGVSGAMYVGGEVTAYASDAALKTNVVAIGDALSKVEAIRGVSYDWNEAGVALGLGTDKQIGVIAQEVEAVLPELVVQSAHEGYKTVKYDKLTALLIEAVKDLSAKVKTLEAQLGNKSL
jgi:hypothetical protein